MSSQIALGMPLSEFLLETNRLAGMVERHAMRMSAASRGRIAAHTAEEMRNLAEEILQLERERERERKVVGPIRPRIRRAEQLVTQIRAAAKLLALEEPVVAEQLRRLRSGGRQRSAVAAAWSLEMHLALVREHQTELAPALARGLVDQAAQVIAAIEHHERERRALIDASRVRTRKRDAVIAQLVNLASQVRVLKRACETGWTVAQERS